MMVSVIVPFLNAEKTIFRCLEALARQGYENAEFLLIDNGSTDRSRAIVREFFSCNAGFRARLLDEEKKGASAARNRGAREATGEWLVFTDADCAPSSDWLTDLVEAMNRDKDMAGFAGDIQPAQGSNVVSTFLGLYNLPSSSEEKIFQRYTLVDGGFPTANLALRKDVFEAVDGFDAAIEIYGEDHDLCRRVYQMGHQIKKLTKAVVYHIYRTDLRSLWNQAYGFGIAHGMLLRRQPRGALLFDAPGLVFHKVGAGGRVWVDLNLADKKIAAMLILGALWAPLFVLPVAYFTYLCSSILKRARRKHLKITFLETPLFALLLVIKSAGLSCGRLSGSIRHKVFCI